MSIQVSGLSKTYGTKKAVDNISFTINKGEIVGFLGPNGAGKSTTMKILNGFIPPSEGDATVAGFQVLKDPLLVKSKVGYLPESNPLYPDMLVREYLTFIAGLNKVKNKKETVEDLIKKTGLEPESNKAIHQLSKGYKQRVGLAQALINNPEVLILDEPTSGLDPNQLVEIRSLIKNIGKEKTVMLSTHIMQEVEQMCDRVIIINKGKIVADQKVNAIANTTKDVALVEVVFTKPLQPSLLANENVMIKEIINDRHYILESENRMLINQFIYDLSVQYKNPVHEQKTVQVNLENLFRNITKN